MKPVLTIRALFLSAALIFTLVACQTKAPEATTAMSAESGAASVETSTAAESSESGANSESTETKEKDAIPADAEKTYHAVTDTFQAVTMKDVNALLDKKEKEGSLIYAGSLECSYCRDLMPIFGPIVKEKKLKVYYVDAFKDKDFVAFAEKNGIETVPALIYIKEGKATHLPVQSPYQKADVEKTLATVGL